MNKAIYKLIKEAVKEIDIAGVHLDFVKNENIDKDKSYIVYSLVSRTPHYDFDYSKDVYQIAVYSKKLDDALNIQKTIGKYFNSLREKINNIEICECNIDNEIHNYVDEYYQAISMIRILYKY
ncbi:hypothetical protein [uncultured Brachyspira sp.]|uniref:hypothetical protein n=1 Tax=uncultured Brachyspira sp. TaxID=221953 RepID=UPI00258A44DC|nr:hypothetical protein [uncultured Brachyspira sp.]